MSLPLISFLFHYILSRYFLQRNPKEYIEQNVGIKTEYVDTIDDVLNYEK